MDPLTHGLVGAAAAHAAFHPRLGRAAALIGGLTAMSPDLDVYLPRGHDPLAFLVLHRGFTHTLAFVPVGGLLCGALFLLVSAKLRMQWRATLAAALLAYFSHAPIDIITSYGTPWLMPFSDQRLALDVIGIIDPIFTLTLLAGVILGVVRRRMRPTIVALLICGAYLGLGAWQRHVGLNLQAQLAAKRGHVIERGRVLPTPINLIVWRSVYTAADGRIYADTFRFMPWGRARVQPGTSAPRVTPQDLRTLGYDEQTVHDAATYHWFADGYTAREAAGASRLSDMRYLVDAREPVSMWAVELPLPGSGERVRWVAGGRRGDMASALWAAITGADESFVDAEQVKTISR